MDDSFSVDDPVARKWRTIGGGVTDAAPGEVVWVYDGLYTGTVAFNNTSVSLIGESPGGVILDRSGTALGAAVSVNVSGIQVVNLTIKGGAYGVLSAANAHNGSLENVSISNASADCVRVVSSVSWAIRNVTLTGCADTGLYLSSVSRSTFEGLNSSNNGWNVYLFSSGNNSFINLTMDGARSGGSGGIRLQASPDNRFTGGRWISASLYSLVALSSQPYTDNHNTTVENVTCARWNACLDLWNGTEGFVARGLVVADNTYGLYGSYSGSITVEASTFTSNYYYHIYASASFSVPFDKLTVRTTKFNGTTAYYALLLSYGRFGVFENNTFTGADESIHFTFSNHSLVQDNTFNGSVSCAMYAAYTDYLAVYRNSFLAGGCAIRWVESSYWRLRDNSVPNMTDAFQHRVGAPPLPSAYQHDMDGSNVLNGQPVLYVVNATSGSYTGNYSWIVLASSSNISVTAGANVSRNEWGVFAFNLNDSTIASLNLSGNRRGLAAFESYGNTIRDVRAIANTETGLYFSRTARNLVLRPTLIAASSFSGIGIDLDDATHNSTIEAADCTGFATCVRFDEASNYLSLFNSSIRDSYTGVDGASETGARIEGSTFQGNSFRAVSVTGASFAPARGARVINNEINGSGDGIYLAYTSGALIEGNRITNSSGSGVAEFASDLSTVRSNAIRFSYYGVWLSSSPNNLITANNVSNQTFALYFLSGSNGNLLYYNAFYLSAGAVYDAGASNAYDNGYSVGGNYWSNGTHEDDYGGADQDQDGGDGIQDTPQVVYAAYADLFPLVLPWPPPIDLISPANGSLIRTGAPLKFSIPSFFTNASFSLNNGTVNSMPAPFEINTTGAPDGALFVRVWASRGGAINQTATYQFTLDGTAPNITVDGPDPSGAYRAGTQLNFTVSDAHLASNVTWANGSGPFALAAPWDISTVGWADGSYNITIVAFDTLGNVRASSFLFAIDSTAPLISLTSPANGSVIQAGVTLRFAANDTHLAGVTADSGSGPSALPTPFNLSTAGWSDGPYNVTITAIDGAGNSASARYVFVIDSTPPTISLDAPANNSLLRAGTQLNITLSDANLGLTLWDNGSGALVFLAPWDISTAGWADGPVSVTITAADMAGNVRYGVFVFEFDSSAPAIVLRSPVNGSVMNPGPEIDFDVSDPHLGQVTIDMGSGPTSFSPPWNVSTAGLTDATYTFVVIALDGLNNRAELRATFAIDSTAPSLYFSYVGHQGYYDYYQAGVIFNITVGDLHIESIELSLNGGAPVPQSSPFIVNTSGWPDGLHTMAVRASDRASNVVAWDYNFTLDGAAPAISLVGYPLEGWVIPPGYWIHANVSDVNLVNAWYEFSSDPTQSITYFSDPYDINNTGWPDGRVTVHVRAMDKADNVGEIWWNFTIDSIRPNIQVHVEGDEGQYTYWRPGITFHINVTDPNLYEVLLVTDNTSSISSGANYSGSISGWSEGFHHLQVIATDGTGSASSWEYNFTVDGIAPAISLVGYPMEGWVIEPGYWIHADVVDANFFNAWYEFSSDPTHSVTYFTSPFQINNNDWPDGPVTVHVRALDRSDLATDVWWNFTIDSVRPQIDVRVDGREGQYFYYQAGVTFHVNVTDANLFEVGLSVDGAISTTQAASFSRSLSNWSTGVHHLLVIATDGTGQASVWEYNFTVDGTAPTVSLEAPPNGSVIKPGTTINASVADANLAFALYRLSIYSSNGTYFDATYDIATTGWPDGEVLVTVVAEDRAYNRVEFQWRFVVDSVAPQIQLLKLANGSSISPGALVNVSVLDAHLASATWDIGAGSHPLGAPFIIDTSAWPPGNYAVVINATDAAGNRNTATFTLRVVPSAGGGGGDGGLSPELLAALVIAAAGGAAAALWMRRRGASP